ncbi:MAG: PaaX family transcriptional regulator C-terminal domain-containing protein [Pseudomonadota bacterium]
MASDVRPDMRRDTDPAPRFASVDRVLASQPTLRVWSVIVTVFGDSIVPRGGEVWLGTLSGILAGLGIDDQAVRAAVSRLTKDGWLARERVGRNAYYRLLDAAGQDFANATDRIYGPEPAAYDGQACIATARSAVQADPDRAANLIRAGWGRIAAGVFCRFGAGADPPEKGFVTLCGSLDAEDARALVSLAWDLADLAKAYNAFESSFTGLAHRGPEDFDDLESLLLRTLLIHAFRRVVLRDPMLPSDLMPKDWPGRRARRIAAALYQTLSPGAESWLDRHAVDCDGALTKDIAATQDRFVLVD